MNPIFLQDLEITFVVGLIRRPLTLQKAALHLQVKNNERFNEKVFFGCIANNFL